MNKMLVSILLFAVTCSITLTNIHNVNAQQDILTQIKEAYGSRLNGPRWNANADLNKDGIVNLADIVLYCQMKTVPSIIDVSNNIWGGWMMPFTHVLTVNATVEHADQCILSYTYIDGNTSKSVNETMTENGVHYTGTINCDSIPWNANVIFKIYALNQWGLFNESATTSFVTFDDP